MIRHYEERGLLKPALRSEAGYRLYNQKSVDELSFIRQARGLGFSIPQIEVLLRLYRDPRRASKEVRDLARHHLLEVRSRKKELALMEGTLEKMIEACPGDEHPECTILEHLATRKK